MLLYSVLRSLSQVIMLLVDYIQHKGIYYATKMYSLSHFADEDQSDQGTIVTDLVSTINDGEEAFSWAYDDQDDGPVTDTTPWRSITELKWQEDINVFPSVKPFTDSWGPCSSLHTLSPNLSPLDFFYMFVPKGIFSTACKETNNYADFYQDEKRDQGKEWWDWTDSYWVPVEDDEELRTFLGICLVMGVKDLPHPRDYWSTHKDLRVKLVAEAMSMDRFSKLMQYFYLSNPWRDPERIANAERRTEACLREPLYKLSESLLSSVLDGCKTLYNPHQDVLLREMTATASITQPKIQESPDLVWKMLTVEDACNGYIKNAEFHRVSHALDVGGNSQTPFPSENEVCNVLSDLAERDHVLFADSVFISPKTACKLTDLRFDVSSNFSAWPAEFSDTALSPMLSGDTFSRQYGRAVATASKIGSQIHRHLATFDDSQPDPSSDNTGWEDKAANNPIARHKTVLKYSNNESRYIMSKSPLLSRMSKSEWKQLFWVLIDIALMNASVLWKETGRDMLSLSEFIIEVARGLICDGSGKSQKGRSRGGVARKPEVRAPIMPRHIYMQVSPPGSDSLEAPALPHSEGFETPPGLHVHGPPPMKLLRSDELVDVEHSLVKFPGRGRNCKQCTAERLRTRSGRRRDTQFGCDICGINLCRATCFLKFHTIHNLKINRLSITQIATLDFQPPIKKLRTTIGLDGASSSTFIPAQQDVSNEEDGSQQE